MLSAALNPSTARLQLSCGCDLEKVRPMTRAVREFLAEEGTSEDEAAACELALVEACNNAVAYTTENGRKQVIEVETNCDPCQIEMKVYDYTAGFEMTHDVSLPDDDAESGRGLFIIHALMDDVRYYRGADKNTLILRKFRSLPPLEQDPMTFKAVNDLQQRLTESEQIITDMTDELSSCYESLSAIFRAGAELGKTNSLLEFSHALCKDLLEITSSDWFVLRVVPKDDSRLTVFTSNPANLPFDPLTVGISCDSDTTAEMKAAIRGCDIWFGPQAPLDTNDPLLTVHPGGLGLVHPFFFCETLMGVLTVGKKPGRPRFTSAQTNVVHTFAEFLAIQIANARLREEQVHSHLVAHELEIAKNIQRALLPKALPRPANFSLAGYCESAREVGGDFYDVIEVSKNSLLLVIADVMGKGIPAAMFASILRSLLRSTPELSNQPGALLARVNRLLHSDLSDVDMFITAQLVYVDMEKRTMISAGAGHCPALMATPGTPAVKVISAEGMPLGILSDTSFTEESQEFPRNSRLLLYTDGLTESRNGTGQFFGDERLRQWFAAHGNDNAEQIKKSLARELVNFRAHTALHDDQTFIILAEEGEE